MADLFEHPRRFNITVVCFALSALTLGHALQIGNGFYNPTALDWMTGALVLAVLGLAAHRLAPTLTRSSAGVVIAILVAGIAWQLRQLFQASPGFDIGADANRSVFAGLIVAQALTVALGVADSRVLRRLWFPALLAVATGTGVWMLRASPHPQIDVVVVHKEAIDALLQHRDPYRITFANIYGREETARFYNPAELIGGRLAISYPYPPASLLLAVPGQVLFGDYRYAELAALILSAALIGYSRRDLSAKLAAALLLTTPRVWFVIEQGWTEPVALVMLALTVFLLARHSIMAGLAGGVLLVTKQYLGFSGLSALRLMFMEPRRWKSVGGALVFSAAVVTLPLALWHPNAFIKNVILLQALEPFRSDSLSFLAWGVRHGMARGSFVWAVGAGTTAAIASLAATRNTAAGFAASVAVTSFAFFAFGSKAFCNYYFFVIGALCCAIAAFPSSPDRTPASTEA